MNATELLPLVRELYSRCPETRRLLAWGLQSALFLLGYVDDHADEAGIEAARDVALLDFASSSRHAGVLPAALDSAAASRSGEGPH